MKNCMQVATISSKPRAPPKTPSHPSTSCQRLVPHLKEAPPQPPEQVAEFSAPTPSADTQGMKVLGSVYAFKCLPAFCISAVRVPAAKIAASQVAEPCLSMIQQCSTRCTPSRPQFKSKLLEG